MLSIRDIKNLLGDDASSLLGHRCKTIDKKMLHLPGPAHLKDIFGISDRSKEVVKNLSEIYGHGRLKNTGYLSILPVDQGIEHSAGASFAKNPDYFDPENIVRLAIEGGCNAVASTFGVLGIVAKKYADKIPFIVKINHNELLTYPNKFDQVMFGTVQEAKNMGALGVGATIYFGSPESTRQIVEVGQAFAEAHRLGMFTVLWCYLRNKEFKKETDYHTAADLTGQANHLGVTLQADLIKQKLPECNGGYKAVSPEGKYGKFDERIHEPRDEQSHRPRALPGRELLHGPHRSHQFRRRLGQRRPWAGREDRGDQQARGRLRPHLRSEGLPEAPRSGRRAPPCHSGRLPVQGGDDRMREEWQPPTFTHSTKRGCSAAASSNSFPSGEGLRVKRGGSAPACFTAHPVLSH